MTWEKPGDLITNAAGSTILIVDDNPEDLRLSMRVLEKGGYTVAGTTSGREALATLREKTVDLLVLDLSMPEPDGFDILRTVRRTMPQLKILMISGFMDGRLLDAAKQLGATATLQKSLDLDSLLSTVNSLLAVSDNQKHSSAPPTRI